MSLMRKGYPAADSNWKTLLASQPNCYPNRGKNLSRTKPEGTQDRLPSKIWFDGVDPIHLDPEDLPQHNGIDFGNSSALVKNKGSEGLTKIIAMDCEMVGVGDDGTEKDSILARVSIVNHFRKVLYDKYVKPTEPVINYRTSVSGIRPSDMEKGEDFKIVQKEVSEILRNRTLVGHAIQNDLKVLYLGHPKRRIRDTSRYKPFRQLFDGKTPSLKKLTEKILGVKIQAGEHDSVQDAQAAMRLYTMHRLKWEESLRKQNRNVITKNKNVITKNKSEIRDSNLKTKTKDKGVKQVQSESTRKLVRIS